MSETLTSRVSTKGQTVLPIPIRESLGVDAGSILSWELKGDHVVMRKVSDLDVEYHRSLNASLTEWNSPEDNEAYADL